MVSAVEEQKVDLRGAPWRLLKEVCAYNGPRTVREYVAHGGGGTGKSRGIGYVLYYLMDRYPGIRIIVTRKTRESLTDSFLKTWEENVVPKGHPMLLGASRMNRHSYNHPNGSEMVLGGMDKPSKLYSTDYDVWYYQELFEGTEDEWMRARRALRNWGHPDLKLQLLIGDTNPDAEDHWINCRFIDGKTISLPSKHEDNPALFDYDRATKTYTIREEGRAYIDSLDSLKLSDDAPGHLYLRLRMGMWVSASGLVWDTYDRDVNLIDRPELATKREPRDTDLSFKQKQAQELAGILGIRWFFAAVDWGFTEPGSMSVYGVDGDKRIYRVAAIYKTGCDIAEWARWAVDLYKEFNLRAIVCDPSRNDAIKSFNDAIGAPNDGPMRMARPANNAKTTMGPGDMSGLDGVRVRFRKAGDGRARLYLLRDSLRHGRDERLASAKKPYCLEVEIPSYVYAVHDDGRKVKEHTDARCYDHACDELRYACTFVDSGFDLTPPAAPFKFPPGSAGDRFGHAGMFKQ